MRMKQTRKRCLVLARIKLKTLLRISDVVLHGAVLFRKAILIRDTLQTPVLGNHEPARVGGSL